MHTGSFKYSPSRHNFHFAMMNKRIIIERQELTPDNCGGFQQQWFFWREVWARVCPMEDLQHTKFYYPSAQICFAIRYRILQLNLRIVHATKRYKIKSLLHIKRYYTIIAGIEEGGYHA